jgi:hypothetical protein
MTSQYRNPQAIAPRSLEAAIVYKSLLMNRKSLTKLGANADSAETNPVL